MQPSPTVSYALTRTGHYSWCQTAIVELILTLCVMNSLLRWADNNAMLGPNQSRAEQI